jgi:hypothetical protein
MRRMLRLVFHTAVYVLSVSAVISAAINPAGTARFLRRHTRELASTVRTVSASAPGTPVVAAAEITPRPAAQTRALPPNAHRVPIGAVLNAKLRTPVDSRTAQRNDQIDAVLTDAVVEDGVELIPAGSVLHGAIVLAERATKDAPRGRVEMMFTVVQHAETRSRAAIRTRTLTFEAEPPANAARSGKAKRQPIDVVLPAGQPLLLTLGEALLVYIQPPR